MATKELRVPDIGDFKDVPVIEVLVKPGDRVAAEDPLIALESDKASMEVPSPAAGTIEDIHIAVGDRVSAGSLIGTLAVEEAARAPAARPERPAAAAGRPPPVAAAPPAAGAFTTIHASPAVRRLARELGVDVAEVTGSGRKGRILENDVKTHVRRLLKGISAAAVPAPAPVPAPDFARFGPVETQPLSRIRRLSGARLTRVWQSLPMVTVHEEADITATDAFRRQLAAEYQKQDLRVTLLGFLLKAAAAALQAFPEFNASLDPAGENLILKRYRHIGVAVDTPQGLVVPVLRDVDQKGILALCRELAEVSAKARDGRLKAADLEGGTFTLSSLGGIGGSGFTPLVNAPEVAILGVARAQWRPAWDGGQPRLLLPLSLTFDHRVIDGAAAARFLAHLAAGIADLRRLL